MSASTIARWNAISLTRSEEEPATSKRKERDGDSDDDISIASRSPSPAPESMDVDKYDEYIRRPAREIITVETPIKPTNKGFAMLAKLGWVQGQPLGISGEGRVDPIPFQMKADSTGLGKSKQDVEMIETTVSQRRELDSERQQKETEDQRRAREDAVARKTAVAEEISDILKAFYCTLCDKQFKNVAQFNEHQNSYAHHHKARFKDMQANARIMPQEELDKRKEKERKREEKELRKIAAASGIKMAKSTLPASGAPALAPVVNPVAEGSSGFKPSGWANVSSSTKDTSGGFRKAGWASVTAPVDATLAPASSTGWRSVSSASSISPSVPPSFQSGGWSSAQPPPTPPADVSMAPPPPPSLTSTSSSPALAPVDPTTQPPPQEQHPPSKSHLSRIGWQQFQKKKSKR